MENSDKVIKILPSGSCTPCKTSETAQTPSKNPFRSKINAYQQYGSISDHWLYIFGASSQWYSQFREAYTTEPLENLQDCRVLPITFLITPLIIFKGDGRLQASIWRLMRIWSAVAVAERISCIVKPDFRRLKPTGPWSKTSYVRRDGKR